MVVIFKEHSPKNSLSDPTHFSSNKAEPVRMAADPSDFGPPPRSVPKDVGPLPLLDQVPAHFGKSKSSQVEAALRFALTKKGLSDKGQRAMLRC